VNALFVAKHVFTRNTEGIKEELPTKNGEESFVVAGTGLEPMTFGL
jgi:hypothetical protein